MLFLTDAFTTPDANSRSLTPLTRFDLQSLSGGVRDGSVIVECRVSRGQQLFDLTKMYRPSSDSSPPKQRRFGRLTLSNPHTNGNKGKNSVIPNSALNRLEHPHGLSGVRDLLFASDAQNLNYSPSCDFFTPSPSCRPRVRTFDGSNSILTGA